jgi:WD40 repeat protein
MTKRPLLLLLVLLLAACQPSGTRLPDATALPTAETQPTTTTPPTGGEAPTITPPSATRPTSAADAAAAFTDCALLPALPSCGGVLPLTGRLAFNDAAGKRLVVTDFKSGAAWQVPWQDPALASPAGLSFSPSGKLLASFPPGNSGQSYEIYDSASGAPVDHAAPQGVVAWTPQDSFEGTSFRTVWSAAGDQASIDSDTALAHVRFASNPNTDVPWPVSPTPGDQVAQAVAWVPGSDLLLFEQHYAGNSMWTDGGTLSTLNVKTGEIKDLKANMLLNFQFQWHPSEPGVLVFGESAKSPVMGGQQLAVLNVLTGQLVHPISDPNVSVSDPAWLPDGKTILFAAAMPGQTPIAADFFALPAIYTINRDGSGARAVTKPSQTQRDDQPQLLPDGQHLLYFRSEALGGPFSVHLAALDGSLDQAVTGALPPPQCTVTCAWDAVVVYQP